MFMAVQSPAKCLDVPYACDGDFTSDNLGRSIAIFYKEIYIDIREDAPNEHGFPKVALSTD